MDISTTLVIHFVILLIIRVSTCIQIHFECIIQCAQSKFNVGRYMPAMYNSLFLVRLRHCINHLLTYLITSYSLNN